MLNVKKFSKGIAKRLGDQTKDGFEIAAIMEIIQMVMDAIQNCNPSRRRRSLVKAHDRIANGSRFWTIRAKMLIHSTAGELTTPELTTAIIEEFADLDGSVVDTM